MSLQALPFRTILFTLSEVEEIRLSSDGPGTKPYTENYELYSVLQGEGTWRLNEKSWRLQKGDCLLLKPGLLLDCRCSGQSELVYSRIVFCARRTAGTRVGGDRSPDETNAAAGAGEEAELPPTGLVHIQPFGQWQAMLAELHRYGAHTDADGIEGFRQHIRLQELLYYMWSRNDSPTVKDARSAVQETIDELHAAPEHKLDIPALARCANLGVRQFTYWFKLLTGSSPTEYVTALRVEQAKKQLLATSDPVSAIAGRNGFQDAYYFSRRFKQVTGMSPNRFARRGEAGPKIVALYYSGLLISLGVPPVGANLTWWGGRVFLRQQEAAIVDVGLSLQAVAELAPDLILMNNKQLPDYDRLQGIAPTVLIPYDGRRTVFEEALLIGDLIGRREEAERFIHRYERSAARARQRLRRAGLHCEREAAAIIRVENGGRSFSIFGDGYGRSGWAVYRGLRFQAPVQVRQLIDSGEQIEKEVGMARLTDYVGGCDVLFVIHEGEGIASLADRPEWRQLPAVVSGRAFELDYRNYSFFDPISLEGQLALLTELLLPNVR
ncbi:helix-turn-helix domain-containing protein [Paenibacillus hodogayensis]|uniref:Helix-turn-helix domain-containing protein n=1 Tax=Paenibacillus hodogayensis TaxID=279208 RepID=A0ABV5W346_9BACL